MHPLREQVCQAVICVAKYNTQCGLEMQRQYVQGGHFPDHMKFPDFSSSLDR